MATKPSRREPIGTADLESEERRGWLSHGIAALAISALGLAVAGSVVLTTNAQTTAAVVPPQTNLTQTSLPATGQQAGTGKTATGKSTPTSAAPISAARAAALAAFASRSDKFDDPSRDDVRDAIVEERAAQRSEDLSKSAEETAAAAIKAGSKARAEKLAAADLERRQAAVKLAQERSRKAIQERVAAEVRCELAARKAANPTTPGDPAETTPSDPAAPTTGNTDTAQCDTATTPTTTTADPAPNGDSGNTGDSGGAASPVPGAIVGASFGATGAWARYHTGLDFRAGYGTPIRAVTAGQVTYAGNKGNWAGNHVVIKHGDGYSTLSAHMQSISVRVGQSVSANTIIGYVGSTGRAFGAHLHFETYPPGTTPGNVYTADNPINWLRSKGVDTN